MDWREIEKKQNQEGKKYWIKIFIALPVFTLIFLSMFLYLVVYKPH